MNFQIILIISICTLIPILIYSGYKKFKKQEKLGPINTTLLYMNVGFIIGLIMYRLISSIL